MLSDGYNLIQNTNACTITGNTTGNIYGIDPLLGPLQDNGGPTFTHALLPGSPAIDAGNAFGLTTDQRGFPRPYDLPGITNASDGSDIGAYEFNPGVFLDGKTSGVLRLNYFGDSGKANLIEGTFDLSEPDWTPLATRTTDPSGYFSFSDQTTNKSRFYRIVPR